ncbi:MAG: hypothetical protein A2046_11210 [Bacteroidetes bacterium GWA2_30_7]|nr:MAG: hypothetical protein A2046_11210 [Bacteroidetes bacterium GWA2_30_7]
MRLKLILISVIFFSFVSCKKEDNIFSSYQKKITRTSWRLASYTDTSSDFMLEEYNKTYTFYEGGSLEVFSSFTNQSYFSTWEFIDDYNYLRIGTNTFKLKSLTRKIMGLQYGTIDLFYVPVED